MILLARRSLEYSLGQASAIACVLISVALKGDCSLHQYNDVLTAQLLVFFKD